MVTVKLNIAPVVDLIKAKIEKLQDREYLLRPVAFDVIDLMTKRIHIEGGASDGSQIGTYSKGYMVLRTGKYKNSTTNSGGITDAGVFTDRAIRLNKKTGVFTGEEKVGKARQNYNRSSDTKVVVSLTRQLENDWSVIATRRGYGIGFKNSFNFQKARWVEKIKGKVIFNMTSGELKYAIDKVNELAGAALK